MIVAGLVFWLCIFMIFYTYAGYPLIVAILSRFYPAEKIYPPQTPSVTLIIAAYNEGRVISEKLMNCLELDYPRHLLQIIVAADGSDDDTVEIVRGFSEKGIELSYDPVRRGKMSALNRAMETSRNEIVVFSDANNYYADNVLIEIVKPYSNPVVGAVTGSKRILKDDSQLGSADGLYWKYESFIKRMENRIGCCMGVSGEIFSLRKSLFVPPSGKIVNDDFYMAMDVISRGYRVLYNPAASSMEKISLSEQDEITRRARIFAGQIQILFEAFHKLPFRHPILLLMMVSHKFLRSFVPLAMMAAFGANLIVFVAPPSNTYAWLQLSMPYNIIFMLLQVGFYLIAFFGMKVKSGGLLGKAVYLPVFLVNSNYAAWLGILRYFSGEQTVIWKKVGR